MELIYYFNNLDNKTRTLLLAGFICSFLILKNFFTITAQTFFALIISLGIVYFITKNLRFNLNNDLDKIKEYNKLLNLDYFDYLPKDINLVIIYNNLYKLGKADKYDFIDSMKATETLLHYYHLIFRGVPNYKQIIDLAEDERDKALNHLQVISNSIKPIYALAINNTVIPNLDNINLNKNIQELKTLLENYIFEMYRISRKYYDEEKITNESYPITYNNADPKPNNELLKSSFDLYYGSVQP